MNVVIQLLAYILIASQNSRADDFLCTFDTHLTEIKLEECPDKSRIYFLGFSTVTRKNKSSHCGKVSTKEVLTYNQYGNSNEITQKILRNCSLQQSCIVGLYNDGYRSEDTRGILIRYDCVADSTVIQFCQKAILKRHVIGDAYLVHDARYSSESDRCSCVAEYQSYAYIFLTHIPTNREYLVRETRKNGKQEVIPYNDRIYTNQNITNHSEKDNFTVVTRAGKTKVEDAFTLFKIAAKDATSNFSLQCSRVTINVPHITPPVQTESIPTSTSNTEVVVVPVVTVLCILGIIVLVTILYRRHLNKRKTDLEKGTILENKGRITSDSTSNGQRRVLSSVYVDPTGRLTGSYADVGSISDYRHYVSPDDISHRSLKIKTQYKTLIEEESDSEENPTHSRDTSVTSQNNLSITVNDETKHDSFKIREKDRGPVHCSNLKSDRITDNTKNVSDATKPGAYSDDSSIRTSDSKEEKNDAKSCASSIGKMNDGYKCTTTMLPQEHYDPSGYLSLDVAEKTTNASLTKWKTEIYSIERAAREMNGNRSNMNDDSDKVGRRAVRIVPKPLPCKPTGYPYHYVNKHSIKFQEDETVIKPEIKNEDRATNEDKVAIA